MVTFPNCKINLGLNILRKRSDGFHDLESVFYPVKLCDALEIVEIQNNKELPLFTNTGLLIDAPLEKNLVVKAYNLLKTDFQLPDIAIHLHKVIPFGAGLGGGSSNAAFTLTTLNTLFKLNLKNSELRNYAAMLGSDCAFFIENSASFATGKGEILESIDLNLRGLTIVLVKPDIHISTAEAFAGVVPKIPDYSLKASILKPISEWKNLINNNFESHLFEIYPILQHIKNELYANGALFAAMSGSGSTVFGIFDKKIEATSLFTGCFVWHGEL